MYLVPSDERADPREHVHEHPLAAVLAADEEGAEVVLEVEEEVIELPVPTGGDVRGRGDAGGRSEVARLHELLYLPESPHREHLPDELDGLNLLVTREVAAELVELSGVEVHRAVRVVDRDVHAVPFHLFSVSRFIGYVNRNISLNRPE